MSANVTDEVLTWLEAHCPVHVGLERIESDPSGLPDAMMHAENVPVQVRAYKSGQRVMSFRFSVHLRDRLDDARGRIEADGLLRGISEAWKAADFDGLVLTRRPMVETYPVLTDATENYETYSATLSLEYLTD